MDFYSEMVQAVDHQSSKSGLLPPSPMEIARLAEQSRKMPATVVPESKRTVLHPFLKRRLSADVVATILARRKAGETTKTLCEEYGLSESGLSDLMVRAEAPERTNPITPEDIDIAVQLYESGLTVKQVVVQLGYSIRTIRRVLHERGVTMRVSGKQR